MHIEIIWYWTFSCDFLGPFMLTFDDLSLVLIFVYQKWPSVQLLKKLPNMVQIGPNWSKLVQSVPKSTKIIQNHSNDPQLPIWVILCNLGQFWLIIFQKCLVWIVMETLQGSIEIYLVWGVTLTVIMSC